VLPAAAPPHPYVGTFVLEIGAERILLTAFGGCFDKIPGTEYEDCYFRTAAVSPALMEWVNDTVTGSNPLRETTLVKLDGGTQNEQSRIRIQNGFLRDFSVSDFDASKTVDGTKNSPTSPLGSFGFVVVPANLQAEQPGGGPTWPVNTTFQIGFVDFDVKDFSGVSGGSHAATVRGVHLSVDKVISSPLGSRRQFVPGALHFGDLRVQVAGAATTSQFETWVEQVASGTAGGSIGTLALQTQLAQTIATIRFFDLVPSAFEPYPTFSDWRAIGLSVGSFQFE
jgi:hypothetical protein